MPDLRFLKPKKANSVFFDKFEIDFSNRGGFCVKLNWNFNFDSTVVGFRIYKSVSSKPLLKQSYNLTQKFFEKTTPNLQKTAISNILYTKSFASENSKVSFFQSEGRFKKIDEKFPNNFNYKKIGFKRQNRKNNTYQFVDENIIFGETYNYLLTVIDRNLQESLISVPLLVNAEDLEPASAIKDVSVNEMNNSLLFILDLEKADDIMGFDFFRKNLKTQKYDFIYHLKNDQKINIFSDLNIIPGNVYEYKIFSVDYFNQKSYEGLYKKVLYQSTKLKTGAIPDPIVNIFIEDKFVKIIGKKNDDNVIGYRIERQDMWKYDQGFSLKTYNFIPWSNCILFDQNKEIVFEDFGVVPDKIYKYRISSIVKNTSVGSYFVSPPLRINKEEQDIIHIPVSNTKNNISILDFGADIVDKKQNPIFIKFSWNIVGPWERVKLSFSDGQEQIVDNIHNFIYYNKLSKNTKYKVKLNVFDQERNIIENLQKEISLSL